jgi:hypothetical protein
MCEHRINDKFRVKNIINRMFFIHQSSNDYRSQPAAISEIGVNISSELEESIDDLVKRYRVIRMI